MAQENDEAPELERDEETDGLDQDERVEERTHHWARAWWERRRVEPEERDHTLGQLFYEAERRKPYLYRFALLQALSVVIAVIGVISDAPAIVIGAMLLSPLMTPVLAVAAALVMIWPKRVTRAILVLLATSVGSILLAWLVAAVMPEVRVAVLSDELVSRTRPTLLDLAVALAAGAAGGYAMVREEVGSALPGVAVAVALVPPLAVVGAAIDVNEIDMAVGAGLLYLTNLSAIVLAGGVVFLATGFIPTVRITRLSRQVALAVVLALVPVAAVAIPLSRSLTSAARDDHTQTIASQEVESWIEGLRLEVVGVDVDGDQVFVELLGEDPAPPASHLGVRLERLLERPVSVTVSLIERSRDVYVPPDP